MWTVFLCQRVLKGLLFTRNDYMEMLFARYRTKFAELDFLVNLPSTNRLIDGFDKWQCYLSAKKAFYEHLKPKG